MHATILQNGAQDLTSYVEASATGRIVSVSKDELQGNTARMLQWKLENVLS